MKEKCLIHTSYVPQSNAFILSELLEDGLLRRCVEFQFKKLCKLDPEKMQFKEDMFQDLVIVILNYDNAKLNNAREHKHLNALITAILTRQLYSNSSKFYTSYIKFSKHSAELWDCHNDEDDDE